MANSERAAIDLDDLVATIGALVERVEHDGAAIGVISTGEAIAVALVLDRQDLLHIPKLGGYTMLEAVERLGTEWFRAALAVQRSR
jgi:hypothetical protein